MMIYEHLVKVWKGLTLLMGWHGSLATCMNCLRLTITSVCNVVSQLMRLSVACVKNMFAFSISQFYKLSYMILNIVMC